MIKTEYGSVISVYFLQLKAQAQAKPKNKELVLGNFIFIQFCYHLQLSQGRPLQTTTMYVRLRLCVCV